MGTHRALRYGTIALILAAITCGDIDKFTIEESSSTTIQGASLLEQLAGDLGFGGFLNMDISQNQELQNQGVEREQIDSVHIQSLTLTITDTPPEGRDFTFIDNLEFFVESQGLERKLIASGGPFAAGLTTVGLEVENVDLAPYAAAESMNITSEVTGRRPSKETTIDGKIVLEVDVNVSGALCGGD
ncbi:MAG: hypothetical protein A2289_26415 [Deltaproteobacteria bacterium RIFOXYA12_FULL_58_15]|nr:MAG: hypothetical protein A2289_26415 [Deltaproteobacteria bacterium RIFOXYA12_FULL_58_15]